MNESGRVFNWFTSSRFGVLLALLIFAWFPQVILGLQTFVVRDYGFFVYPLADFQRECFWRGELPFWDPYNYCGVPFLAQWNTMPLYPLSLIYLVPPLTWGLGFFCLLHLWIAGMGMYFLARRWTQNSFAAAFAGTIFAFNGFTQNLIMWPSHLATFAWMPWVVLAVENAWRDGGRQIFFAAIAGTMQMLAGGPEIIFFTWIILVALWLEQIATNKSLRLKFIWRLPAVIVLVAALSALQTFPFLDLVAHSQRRANYIDTRWSLPLRGWMNFLVPMAFGGTWDMGVFYQYDQEWTSSYYLGIGALWLALLGLWKARRRRIYLLAAILVAALILSLGENTFVLPALRKMIPQLRLITHSIKYLAVVIFIAPLLAAFALEQVQEAEANLKVIWRRSFTIVGAVLFTLIVIVLFWAWRFPFPEDDVHRTLLNGLSRIVFLLIFGAMIFYFASRSEGRFHRLLPLILIIVVWLDLFTHEPAQNPTAPPSIYEPDLARKSLAMQPQPALGQSRAMDSARTYHSLLHFAINPRQNYLVNRMAYAQNCNLLDHVPKVDGFLSLCPREADDLNTLLYSTNSVDVPHLEDFMGVSQITATNDILKWKSRSNFLPLVTAGQKPYFWDDYSTWRALSDPKFDGARIVLLPGETANLVGFTNQTSARVLGSTFKTQRVDIEAEAAEPSLVVIAQTYYHDWSARVDGRPAPLLRANYAFQAVKIPAGRHHIELIYRDRAFEIGAAVSLITFCGCLAGLFVVQKKFKKT